MARTNATAVKILIETELSDASVDAFIADAAALLTSSGADAATCHTSASLTVLEKYVAAHLVALRERQQTSTKEQDAEDRYGGQFGMDWDFTQYGQQALKYDCSKLLVGLGKPAMQMITAGGAGEA